MSVSKSEVDQALHLFAERLRQRGKVDLALAIENYEDYISDKVESEFQSQIREKPKPRARKQQ
jgi:hypothetical protein